MESAISAEGLLCLGHEEQVLIFKLDILLFLAHLAVFQQVEHIFLPQEPLQERNEGLFHLDLVFLLRSN
jgi:hypothetical protein